MPRRTLGERFAEQIRRAILRGQLNGGTRLESCRAMAREGGIGVGTVREALAQLRGEGLIEIRHGVGVFVLKRPRRARVARAARRTASRREVEELRAATEPLAAERAAKRATDRQVVDLWHMVGERERERRSGNRQAFAAADVAVHRAVYRMSGNRLVTAAAELAGPVLARRMSADAHAFGDDRLLQDLHERLADAIDRQRPGRARRLAAIIAAREGGAEPRAP